MSAKLKEKGIKLDVRIEKKTLIDEELQEKEDNKDEGKIQLITMEEQEEENSFRKKVEEIIQHEKMRHLDGIFVSSSEEVNWILNKRALGIHKYEPMFNSFLLILKHDQTS